MKKVNIVFLSFAFAAIFAGCQKENISIQQTNAQSEKNSASVITTTEAGKTKLILRPGPTDGQDTYIALLKSNPDYANGTGDFAEELSMQSWTSGGSPLFVRAFIRFDKLSTVPPTSKVLKATLFLYAKGSSISNPNGNSIYPGSPYSNYQDNSCVVAKVTGANWDESTLTWNTQPAINKAGAALIPPSDSQWNYDAEVDVTAMVKKMVQNPLTNYGFRISLVNENIYRSMIFASSENTDENKRPMLKVIYE